MQKQNTNNTLTGGVIDTTKLTLKDYLFASGVLETGDSSAIEKAKKTYRKAYLKQKKAEHRRTHTTVSLSFPKAEAAQLEKLAAQHFMKLSPFVKECVRAYTKQQFIVPNADEVQELDLLIRNIGNNVNQIARQCNQTHTHPHQAIEYVKAVLQKWDSHITTSLRTPDSIEALLYNKLLTESDFTERVEAIIAHAQQQRKAKRIE